MYFFCFSTISMSKPCTITLKFDRYSNFLSLSFVDKWLDAVKPHAEREKHQFILLHESC